MRIRVVTDHQPKFRRLDRAYPLKNFTSFLLEHGLTKNTIGAYLGALRQLLAATGEGEPDPTTGDIRRRTWEDRAAVEAYTEQLPRPKHAVLQSAWSHWQAFNKGTDPTRSLTQRTLHSTVAGALRTLLAFRDDGVGVPPFKTTDLPLLVWEYDQADQRWYVAFGQGSTTRHTFGIGARVLAKVIREWGWPKACPPGAPFLPLQPGDMTPMPMDQIHALLDNKITQAVAAWLDAKVEADYEAAASTLHVAQRISVPSHYVEEEKRPMKSVTAMRRDETGHVVVGHDETLGKIRLVDGKLEVENKEDDGLPDWA